MKRVIKQYSGIYKEFVMTSTAQATSFRSSFVLMMIMDIFFFYSAIFTVQFIYDHVASIGGWKKEQLMFFISFMLAVDIVHMMVLSHNFWRFSDDIKTGNLDYTLLRPASSIFIAFFRYFKPSSIPTAFLAFGTLIYYGMQNNFGPLQWIVLPFLILISFALLAVLEFIISCAMFWVVEGLGINFLRMQMQSVSRWPDFIYGYFTKKILTFMIPVLVIGSAPVKFLFDPSKAQMLILLVAALVVSIGVLKLLWSKGLNKYDSASS